MGKNTSIFYVEETFKKGYFLDEVSLPIYKEKKFLVYPLLKESTRLPNKYYAANIYLDPSYKEGIRIHFDSADGFDIYIPFLAIDSIIINNSLTPKKKGLMGLLDKKPNGGSITFGLHNVEDLVKLNKETPFPNVNYLYFRDWKSDKKRLNFGLSLSLPQGEMPLVNDNGKITVKEKGEVRSIIKFFYIIGGIKVYTKPHKDGPNADIVF